MKTSIRYIYGLSSIALPIILAGAAINELSQYDSGFLVSEFNRLDTPRNLDSDFQDSNNSTMPAGPMELINVLRRATAMDDATKPSDALDDAIRAFETQDLDNSIAPLN